MTNKSQTIQKVCDLLLASDRSGASQIAHTEYPFVIQTLAGRKYTELESTGIFIRDGFIDRYSGDRLVFPGVLRLISRLLPQEFPFHPNWKMSECHIAYWELSPTIDHVVPVARGGADDETNWITTLLIDGYDEVSFDDRKAVSEALREFTSLQAGNFYLTCRSFYEIIDLQAPYYYIDDFNREDTIGYLRSFAKAYKATFDAEELMLELEEHGFGDFLSHPLMLALVCILKSGTMPKLPQNTIGLLRRAIDTLTFRWDESKGLDRESRINLDGEERVRCLMRIAHNMHELLASESKVYVYAQQHLTLIQRPEINVQKLLIEIAQYYGIFIPVSEVMWSFVHRTMQDYLAARFWVESGTFSPAQVADWDARAAYCACLIPDATESIKTALEESSNVFAFTECLYNNAPYDAQTVAYAIIKHFEKFKDTFTQQKTKSELSVETEQDFFDLASSYLLEELLVASIWERTPRTDWSYKNHIVSHYKVPCDLVTAYTLAEYLRRGEKPSPDQLTRLRLLYRSGNFQFKIKKREKTQTFRIQDFYW